MSSSYYTIPTEEENINEEEMTSQVELHRKHRMILFILCSLLCAKSRDLLKHWAMCDPLAHFYKGFSQPCRKSFNGGFSSTLDTCWKLQDKIYEECILSFHEVLQNNPVVHACFDNYNNVLQKKDQAVGKGAITHIGTAFMVREDKPIFLPNDTVIKSSSGYLFNVISCEVVSLVKWHVKGRIIDGHSIDRTRLDEMKLSEMVVIERGFLWPMIGWEVVEMTGFLPMPEVVYDDQLVQPPRLAWVDGNRDRDIVTARFRIWKNANADGATSLLVVYHQAMLKISRRIIDMHSHWTRLLLMHKRRKEEFDNYTPNGDDYDGPPPSPLIYDENTMRFGRVLEEALGEVNPATKYQSDVVKLINPKSGSTDKIFRFPITPYNKTSHEGMKMTYSAIMEALQFVEADDNGRCIALPNAKNRKVHF